MVLDTLKKVVDFLNSIKNEYEPPFAIAPHIIDKLCCWNRNPDDIYFASYEKVLIIFYKTNRGKELSLLLP